MPRKLLVLLVTLAIALVLGELAVRLVLPAPQRISYRKPRDSAGEPRRVASHAGEGGLYLATPTGRRLRPNAHVIIENHGLSGNEVEIRTNALGYRNPEVGPKGAARRVLFLGDSITWGDWLKEEDTFVRRIERLSQEAGRPLETINSAIGAISITEELAILEETGLALEPDVVVLCFYLNDAQPSRMGGPARAPEWLTASRLAWHLWRLLPRDRAGSVAEASRFADELEEVMRGEILEAFPGAEGDPLVEVAAFHREIAAHARDWGSAWSPSAQARIETALREMARLAGERSFELRVVAFPVLLQVQAEFVQDQPQRWMLGLCEELGVEALDLLPLLRREYRAAPGELFYDHCHHTERGNGIVAEAIWRFLQ